MRTSFAIPLALLTLLCASAGSAQARGTYQEGVMSYSVSGSWTSSASSTEHCDVVVGPGETDYRAITSTVTEKGTFASGTGTAHYQGRVGSEPFFLGNGDRPGKLTVKVTRTVSRSATCAQTDPEDCGTRTLTGVVTSEFDGSRPLSLPVHFARHLHDYDLGDVFKTCGGAGEGGIFLSSVNGRDAGYQEHALRYPSQRTFWHRKRLALGGTTKDKYGTFTMRMKTARRTLVSKRDLHP